ncbi:hypothetical protein LTR36_000145 [Oleoguttula mirabilis]|uniref:Uncharacterized protein n=1 Tax=Oleoguttula mirabilis TaxID=1507867 RepID=A0AAV9JZN1_9PEZI|nr:hypothetical protein LTR36_000145 [Oleoguttula mirabilis]
MHSARARKHKFGTDINRYLGVEIPEDRIIVPPLQLPQSRPAAQRNQSSNFSFRDSLVGTLDDRLLGRTDHVQAKMFSTANSVNHMANRQPGSVRRWRNMSSASAGPSTPLRERTNTIKTSSAASANNTTFLPELNSTPPMPTFQKPAIPSPRVTDGGAENVTPNRAYGSGRREALPPIADPGHLLGNPGARVGPALVDRVEETPPLPGGWAQQHDRAICVLDARNYSLATIVAKIRRTFTELNGILTAGMIDKRLRQLDQDVEIDYWRVGLQGTKNAVTASASRMDSGAMLTESMANRVQEPTLKSTMSGSLTKMLPETVSLSTEPSQVNVTSHFGTGYRTQTTHAL